MKPLTLVAPVLAAALLAADGSVALAEELDSEFAPAPPPIEVSVDCDSSPEVVSVRNNRAKPIKLKAVGSTYQKRAGEPYRVKKTLKPGKRATYTFGVGKVKGGRKLSGSYIFDNEAPKEGALVKTNRGSVRVQCVEGTNAPPEPEPREPVEDEVELAAAGDPVDAPALLATLPVEPEVEDGYERQLFEHWVDADGDGCDTRQEVLISDSLTPVTLGEGCRIDGGSWYSSADGDTLTNPASIDINHVVPLKEAWASGAFEWTPERRQAFANDLLDERTLQAGSAGANRQQGENDPASWLPADLEAACRFVADWVAIKASWQLAVDQAERDAIELTLDNCGVRSVVAVPRETEEPAASD